MPASWSLSHLYIVGFGTQTRAVTCVTHCLALIAGAHYAILYLVLVGVDHLEKLVDARKLGIGQLGRAHLLGGRAVPQERFLLGREVGIGGVDWKTKLDGVVDKHAAPFAHLLSAPACHGLVIDRERGVGYDQTLVDAEHPPETTAHGACSDGVVEVEHHVGGLLKAYAVSLEFLGEFARHASAFRLPHHQGERVVTLEESCLGRVGQAAQLVAFVRDGQTVDHEHVV